MPVFEDVLQTIGNTPLIRLNKIDRFLKETKLSDKVEIFAKMEGVNPGGSVKSRVAKRMILNAEKAGKLHPASHIVEPTSGNTGIGLAMVGAVKGYRVTLVMPENASLERRKIMKAYGAEVVLTPAGEGMKGAIAKAEQMAAADPNVFIPNQFENYANVQAHMEQTAREIWRDMEGRVDAAVFAVGTGGTLTGIGQILKILNPEISIVALEPENSPVLSNGTAGPHKIQGMGAGFISKIMNTEIIDEIITISDDEAYKFTRLLAKHEGLLVGISSGAAMTGVVKHLLRHSEHISRKFHEGKPDGAAGQNKYRVVTLFPDTGERYLSTELW